MNASRVKKILPAALGLAFLTTAACGGGASSEMQILRSEVFNLRQEQHQLSHQVSVLDSLIGQRGGSVDDIRAAYKNDIRQLNEQIATLTQRISDTEQRMLRLQSEVETQASAPRSVKSDSSSGGAAQPANGPQQMYELAYKDFTASNYEMAIEGFRDFLTRFPKVPLAAQANLYIGNSYRALKKYEDAIKAYSRINESFPDSPLVPDALYRIGDCYISLGKKDRGETFLQTVIQRFPDSNAAAMARARLNP